MSVSVDISSPSAWRTLCGPLFRIWFTVLMPSSFTYLVAYLLFWFWSSSPVVSLQSFSVAHVCIGSLVPPLPGHQSALKSPDSMHAFAGVLKFLNCFVSVMPLIHSSGMPL